MKKTMKLLSVALAAAMVSTAFVLPMAVPTASAAETDTAAVTANTPSASDFSWDNASVYFLLTDRFKNGNTANDHSYNRGLNQDGTVATAADGLTTDAATFHGGDFAGITEKIKDGYFNDLGINALWISAPYEQTHGYSVGGTTTNSYPHYAYHGYYVLDYTETDANFGTAEEFQTLVDTAHQYGLRVVLDVVMNHSGYNTLYDMNEYGFGALKTGWETAYYNWGKVNNTVYHSYVDYNSVAGWAKWWGKDWVRAGLGDYTPGGSTDQTKSLDMLPDFKTESTATVDIPEILKTKWTQEGVLNQKVSEADAWFAKTGKAKTVRNYQIFWLSSWVREYGVDGFRCDTALNVDVESWGALKDECVTALKEWKAANPDKALDDKEFWTVGEVWGHKLSYDNYYTTGKFDSLINFTYQNGKGLPAVSSLNSTYNTYASALNTNDNYNVLTYISSHDTALCRTDLIYQGSALMLMPGGVQVYYGDESDRQLLKVQVDGKNYNIADHRLRSDMNWDTTDTAVLSHWQKVGTFRNNHVAIGAGTNTAADTTNGMAFVRKYDKDGVKDVVAAGIANDANTNVTIDVSAAFANGTIVKNAYDGINAKVTDGKVTFNSGDNKTILIEATSETTLTGLCGDANQDGVVNIKDSIVINKTVSHLTELTGDAFKLADTNKDGKITVSDSIMIQKYAAKITVANVGQIMDL